MRVFIGAVGSGGDVNPMLTLGAELQRRGHECTLLAGEWQAPAARALGLEFHPILSSAQFARYTANVAVADSPGTGWITFFYDAVFPAIAPAVEHVCERAPGPDTCLIGASHVIGLRLAAECLGLPHVTTLAQPEPVRPPAEDPFCVYFNGLFGRLFDQQRCALGLNPSPLPFMQWLDTRRRAAALFPQWFPVSGIDASPDARTVALDFLLDDPDPTARTTVAIDAFLATHEAPLVFTFGTGSRHVRQLFELAVSSALALERPAILLTRERDQLPQPLPSGLVHADYIPLGELLPFAAAIVHHGGIGTCAQALRAGIPQLVIPGGFDQFDNAARMVAFGVGARLLPEQVSKTALVDALRELLHSPQVAQRCLEVRRRFDPTHTAAWCCDAIEALARAAA